jgi:hypothetical protein
MSARVYMLLDILEEKYECALQVLQKIGGVIMTDSLEGHPNTLVIVEAPDREKLVERMMPVLGSVDRVTEDLSLLVSQGDGRALRYFEPAETATHDTPVY